MTRPAKQRVILGIGLVVAVLATRLPLLARTLFEFDSVDFTVALFRFNLDQVTPHMPGYIVHILLGRFLTLFISNPATMWGVLSTLLSVGSELFLWRAAARLRGERVGLIAALIWLTTPAFWFYGVVSTVYIHEAFFASAILYFGIRHFREGASASSAVWLGITLSLAAGARQSSLLFFLPSIIFLFWRTRTSRRSLLLFFGALVLVSFAWGAVLLAESGGLVSYLTHLSDETIYRSQSVFYGNPLSEHFAVMAKLLFYLLAASVPMLVIFAVSLFVSARSVAGILRLAARSTLFYFVVLVAVPPFLFYLLVYFMKGGYLLNILPSLILAAAVLLDAAAIALARRQKERHVATPEVYQFARPLIVRNSLLITGMIVLLNSLWFFLPLPGKAFAEFTEAFSHDSLQMGLVSRYSSMDEKLVSTLNRGFAFTSRQSVEASDSINFSLLRSLPERAIIVANYWSRWGYYYRPDAYVYDVTSYEGDSIVADIGSAHRYIRKRETGDTINLPPNLPIFLLMRKDHRDLALLRKGVILSRMPSPDNLAIWRLYLDTTQSFRWKNRIFRIR